jgi:hypothetical protein
MALARTPRSGWIDEGLRALAGGGPEAVRIEPLARTLGGTGVDEVIEAVEAEDGDARARLRRLFGLASASGGELLKTELAIRNWARRDKAVAKRLRQVDNRRMDYMLFGAFCEDDDDVEARCMLAFSLFIGAHFVSADYDGRSRGEVLDLALESLMR